MIEERLLAILKMHATTRGIVPIREEVLLREVRATREDIGIALDKLEHAGLVKIFAPFPFLVLKLQTWPGRDSEPRDSRPPAYSYSRLSSNRLNESYRRGGDALLREILDTLGETDPTSFEGAIKNFPADVIRKALDRVRRTRSLRKNRTALFRYLLTKLS